MSVALIKQAVPQFLQPSLRQVYHAIFRRVLRSRLRFLDLFEAKRDGLPMPRPSLRFRVGETTNIDEFRAVGQRSAECLAAVMAEFGSPLTEGQSVLDFGCGCGRTMVWLSRKFPEVDWSGSDTDAEAVAWCGDNIAGGIFRTNGALPPLQFADASFDIIYGVSVFTHLNEAHQRAWIAELHRVMKPNGLLMMSYYSEQVWRGSAVATDVERDQFVFQTSGKLRGILPDWYHTAFQNQSRILRSYEGHFGVVHYLERRLGNHDLLVARKREI